MADALAALDAAADKCRRCWGGGFVRCALCGDRAAAPPLPADGSPARAAGRPCARCAGGGNERCPACAGYGLHPPGWRDPHA